MDWLSRLLQVVPIEGQLDLRCFYGAPWRIDEDRRPAGEIRYHVVLGGSAVLQDSKGGHPLRLTAGDIVMLPQGPAHVLHDGGGKRPLPAREHAEANHVVSENAGTGDRLDMLCGHFVLTPPFDRLIRNYLPTRLVVRASEHSASTAQPGTAAQLANLISLMRAETASDTLGGRAMLNALSTAMFALVLRLASENPEAPTGLLALAGHPRLAPALTAMFDKPEHPWTLPELARLCHMSRATIARQFQEKLGRSASDLLTDLRMTIAAKELKKPSTSVAAVAQLVGYHSEAAFQRVFKQHMGMTPARWRRTMPPS